MNQSSTLVSRVQASFRRPVVRSFVRRGLATKAEAGGFAKSLERHEKVLDSREPTPTFASLLRNSKFIDLGDPENKFVNGTIFHVVNDDLYIDFGWKFYCVCPRPPRNSAEYVRGARVRLKIKDLELSSRFLGMEKDLTLLEADASIVGLVYSPARAQQSTPTS